jgi:hypothetical protein
MKNHITLPLTLVVAAVIIGAATVAIDRGSAPSYPAELAVVENQAPDAVINTVSVTTDNTAAVGGVGSRVIQWDSTNFSAGATVTINLIKKVSDSPISYEFVRTIASNTANDGSESWAPEANESGDAFYIEVVCASASAAGCRTAAMPAKAF